MAKDWLLSVCYSLSGQNFKIAVTSLPKSRMIGVKIMRAITSATTAPTDLHSASAYKRLGQRTKQLIGGIVLGLSLSLLANGEAQAASFTFTKIADTSNDFIGFGLPVINDSGTVAFSGNLDTPHGMLVPPDQGVFTGSGGALTTIITVDNPDIFDPSSFSASSFYVGDINNTGSVAFQRSDSTLLFTRSSILTSSGGTITAIADDENDPRREYVSVSAINDTGTVAFFRGYSGPFSSSTMISAGSVSVGTGNFLLGSYLIFIGGGDINNSGTLVFSGIVLDQEDNMLDRFIDGIFTKSTDGVVTTISTSDPINSSFSAFSSLTINDSGTVAFKALLDQDTQAQGIFTGNGGSLTTIADSSGVFKTFGNLAINNSGEVAFFGSLDEEGSGIFTGADPVTDKVIGTGDNLFESTVTSISFGNHGLNNLGQLAFYAQLANGTSGIFRADPVSDTPDPEPVPEPVSVLGLLAFAAFGAGSVDKRQKKQQA
jgi:hypothetical protein